MSQGKTSILPQPQRWSKAAVASAILGICGFVTLGLGIGLLVAAIAAVLGHVGHYDASLRKMRGRRLGTLGMIFGYGSLLVFPILILLVALSFPALDMWKSDQDERLREESRSKASRLFLACEEYARAHGDRYPAEWQQLAGRFVPSDELDRLLQSPHPGGRKVAYEIVPHDRPVLEAIADSVIVIQEVAPPGVHEISVVYASGAVARMHNPDHEDS